MINIIIFWRSRGFKWDSNYVGYLIDQIVLVGLIDSLNDPCT